MYLSITGGRGFLVYAVNGTDDPATIDTTLTPALHVDQSSWQSENWPPHSLKMVGLFMPQESGRYKLCVNSTGNAQLYVSTDDDPQNKVSNILLHFHVHI